MFLEMEILYLSSFVFVSGDPFYLHNLQASDHLFDLRPPSSSSSSSSLVVGLQSMKSLFISKKSSQAVLLNK